MAEGDQGYGPSTTNHPSDAWQVQVNNMLQMFGPMFGLHNRQFANNPLGMSSAQMMLQADMDKSRKQVYQNWTQHNYDRFAGSGAYGRLSPTVQQAIGMGAQQLGALDMPMLTDAATAIMGYNPFAMGGIAETQRSIFLNRGEFLGSGTQAEQSARQSRLYAAAGVSWQDAIRASETTAGRGALSNVWAGRADKAFEFTAMLSRGGVRGIFGSDGSVNDTTYNKWVGAGAAVGNVLQTNDVGKIYETIKRSSGGLRSEMDPDIMKQEFDKISRMAHYLDVSAKEMEKTIGDIQDVVKSRTGSHMSVAGARSIVGTSIAQGRMAGLSPQGIVEQVGWSVDQASQARSSLAGGMLSVMLDKTAGLSAAEIRGLEGKSADGIIAAFRGFGLNEKLAIDQMYLSNIRGNQSAETRAFQERVERAGLSKEYGMLASSASANTAFQVGADQLSGTGNSGAVGRAKLTALKGMLANGVIGADSAFLQRQVAEMEGKGLSGNAIVERIRAMSGLTGENKAAFNTELTGRAAGLMADDVSKYGAFDNMVNSLKGMQGGLSLDEGQLRAMREEYASNPNAVRERLLQGSKFGGANGSRSTFDTLWGTASRQAQGTEGQIRKHARYQSAMSALGGAGPDADSQAIAKYMALKNIQDIDSALSGDGELSYEKKALLESSLAATGLYSNSELNAIMRGDKGDIQGAVANTRRIMDPYVASIEEGAALATDASSKAIVARQRTNVDEMSKGGPVQNSQPVTVADMAKGLIEIVPKLIQGLESFSGALEKAINRLFPENGASTSPKPYDKNKGNKEGNDKLLDATAGTSQTLRIIMEPLTFGGTPVTKVKAYTVNKTGDGPIAVGG